MKLRVNTENMATPPERFRKLLLYPPELRGRKHLRRTRFGF